MTTRLVITDPDAAARFLGRIRPGRPATSPTPGSGPENAPTGPKEGHMTPTTTQVVTTVHAANGGDVYTIEKTVVRNPYSGLTAFTVHQGNAHITVNVYHPEHDPGAPHPYRAARINWPGTESARLARGMSDALRLAADEADLLNQQYAEQWASDEVEDDGDWLPRVRMILEELTP